MFPDLSIAENIFIGHQGRGALPPGQMFRRAGEILASIGVTLEVRGSARGLTLAAQQSVEIAKAISVNVQVLIMDEPTASLSAHEAEQLFRLVGELKAKGVAILFVSHRMDEVFRLADTITVFRDGRHVSTRPRAEVTPQSAVADMVGREMGLLQPRASTVRDDLLLKVDGLSRTGAFADVGFDLRRGEVLGFAGLIGAGRTDVGLAIFGIQPANWGRSHSRAKPSPFESRATPSSAASPTFPRTAGSLDCLCRWRSTPMCRCPRSRAFAIGRARSMSAKKGKLQSAIASSWQFERLRSKFRWATSPAATSRRSCSPNGCARSRTC